MCGTTLAWGALLLANVIGPSLCGLEFLHIQYRGIVNVVDHTAAKLSRSMAVRAYLVYHQDLLTTLYNQHSPLHLGEHPW